MRRGQIVAAVTGAMLLAALGACGGSGPEVSIGGSHAKQPSSVSPAASAPGKQTVRYHGEAFDVPADWPVYDLASDPTRCVRFDVHAVYLGHPGADQNCPAHLVGKTESVLVEPLDATSKGRAAVATAARTINGQDVSVDPSATLPSHDIVAAFQGAAVVATITFGADKPSAQAILDSFVTR